MKSALKKQWVLILSLFIVVVLSGLQIGHVKAKCDALDPICGGPIDSNTRPYFKTFGADVFAGGWLGNSCGSSVNYQDPFYSNPPTYPASNIYGGIQAFAKEDSGASAGGASSRYGAFALGLIEAPDAPKGFYGSGATAPAAKDLLNFANNDAAASWGGKFQGAVRQPHCIPDYFGKPHASATDLSEGTFPTTSGTYQATKNGATTFNLNGVPSILNPGTNITIFIDGHVYIGNNITYNLDKVDNVPKFTLVVRGDIFIDPAVTRLDGFYIAQPHNPDAAASVASDDGVIWTCHPNSLDGLPDSYPNTCVNRLVINGAIAAKQINLLRNRGDVRTTGNTAEDSDCAAAIANNTAESSAACANIAEMINYSPPMIIGGPFFNSSGGANSGYKIKSLLNLPPVF